MTLQELFEAMSDKSRKGATGYALEFHQRLALPLSCLCLGLIGPPLGSFFRQRSRMTGITLGWGSFWPTMFCFPPGKVLERTTSFRPEWVCGRPTSSRQPWHCTYGE